MADLKATNEDDDDDTEMNFLILQVVAGDTIKKAEILIFINRCEKFVVCFRIWRLYPLIYQLRGPGKPTKNKGYWFPYKFKYVAWVIVLAGIVTASIFLVLYGLTFGLIKCYLWLTAVLMSICIGLAILQPTKIFLMSYIMALVFKSPPSLQFKKIPDSLLKNEYDEKRDFIALKRRLDNTPYYAPIPKHRLEVMPNENRAQNIKYHLEQRKLFVEFTIFILFALVLTYIVVAHRSWFAYYNTEAVKHLIIYGSYTNTIPFEEVTSYRQFIEYLNTTLFPSLFGVAKRFRQAPDVRFKEGSSWSDTNRNSKSKADRNAHTETRRSSSFQLPVWDEESLYDVRERFLRAVNESLKNVTHIYERSWTLDRSIKMIGKPRMRQLRVKNNTCSGIKEIKPREKPCFAEFSLINEEKGNYWLWWKDYRDESLTLKERRPWMYENYWKTGAVYLVAKHASYPAGGYILEFAKNLDDCRVILNFMDAFQWIDARTRAVIIEFTLYSVNVNLFNVVHLIAERSASGYFITSFQIDTAKFMFLASELEIMTNVMIIAFDILMLLFLYRQAIRIERTSFKSYITEGNPTIDILIIFLGLVSVIFIFLRTYYVASLLSTLDRSQNYEYVSFAYAALWDRISTYINAALVILASIKLFQLLRFRVVFLQLQETLKGCSRYLFALGFQLLIVLIAFSFFFHLVLLPYAYDFSTLGLTLSTLIGGALNLDDSYDYSVFANTPWFVAPLFYSLFLIFMTVIILSFFVSVICFYLSRVKSTQIRNKYNAITYLKYVLTANNKTDIMRLRGGCSPCGDISGSPLRLRGGGAACARICLKNREEYQFPPKYATNNELIKRGQPIFTKAKVYDFHHSYHLEDLYRFEAMKRLVKAELESNSSAKEADRELAMKALVARRLRPPAGTLLEKYYTVVDGDERTLVTTARLVEMKEIVDNYGREKLLEKYRNVGINLKIIEDEEEDWSKTFKELFIKLSQLQVVVDKKYKEERKRKSEERKKLRSSKTISGGLEGEEKPPRLTELSNEAKEGQKNFKGEPSEISKMKDSKEEINEGDQEEQRKQASKQKEEAAKPNKDKERIEKSKKSGKKKKAKSVVN